MIDLDALTTARATTREWTGKGGRIGRLCTAVLAAAVVAAFIGQMVLGYCPVP